MMALRGIVIYLKCVLVWMVFSVVSSLTLSNLGTTKPRQTKYSTVTPPPIKNALGSPSTTSTSSTLPPGIALYRIKDSKGATCILLETDGLVEVSFLTSVGEEKGDNYMPDNPLLEGDCTNEDNQFMRLMWNGYSLVFNFAKTPGGERWYISKLELTVSTDLPQYHNIRTTGNNIKLVHTTMVLPTPVGKSFQCKETIIKLVPYEDDTLSNQEGITGTLFLRALQVQPFMYKGNDFGPPFECTTQLGFRDETAPIAVGSTLAVAVLLTVAGYGAFRYYKIKKVQYNTME